MQNELSSRIEKIWAMADIALKQGHIDYGIDGHCKIAKLAGLKFKFINGVLARVRGPRLDLSIAYHQPQGGVVFFPGSEMVINFNTGDDAVLDRIYRELDVMQRTFSAKAA